MPEKPPGFSSWGSPAGSHIPDEWLQQVWAYLVQHPPPIPIGQITGYGGSLITGRVSSGGGRLAGSGYTVAKIGTGEYRVTYTRKFAKEPVVFASLIGDPSQGGGAVVYGITTSNETKFEIQWDVVGGANADQSFDFVVILTR